MLREGMDDQTATRRGYLRALGMGAAVGVTGCTSRGIAGSPPQLARTATTQFRGGLTRRGVYPNRSVPDSVTVDWRIRRVNTGDHTAAKSSPVRLPSGDVVVAGDDGVVRRVTPAGEQRWQSVVEPSSRGIHGTPAVANGAVYVGAYDGALYAFDVETGDRMWRSKLGDAIGSSPGYYDGVVYIAVEYYDPSGAMFGVDAASGEVVWEDRRPTDHPHSTCAIDREAGRLVVGSNDGRLYAWSYPGLSFEWSFETGRAIKGPVATHDGRAFFGSWDGHVYAVGLAEGTEEWAFETGDMVMSGPSVDPHRGEVYVGGHSSRLYALSAAGGDLRWDFDTDGWIIGCPTVTARTVLVGSYDDALYAVDRRTGDQVWRIEAEGRVTSTPLVTREAVYFTDRATDAYLGDGNGATGSLWRLVEG